MFALYDQDKDGYISRYETRESKYVHINPENIKFYEVEKCSKWNFLQSSNENSKIQFLMNIYI